MRDPARLQPVSLALKNVVTTVKDPWAGLIANLRHRVTNGLAKSINGRIQQLKTKPRGFRSLVGFRRAILFPLEQLDLYP